MTQPRFQTILIRSAMALVAVVSVLGIASSAGAQLTHGRIRATPQRGAGFTACLAMEGEKCRLIAPAVAIAIGVESGDAVISYLDPSQAGYVVQRKESVALDLEKAMAQGTYGSTQAALIFAELLSMHELMYRLPADQMELKRAMGFPAQVQLSATDQIGVLTSHLQLTLSVSAITADYLISKLGLKVIEDEVTPSLTPESPEFEEAPVRAATPVVQPPESQNPALELPVVQPLPSEDPNLHEEPSAQPRFEGVYPVSTPPELTPEMVL